MHSHWPEQFIDFNYLIAKAMGLFAHYILQHLLQYEKVFSFVVNMASYLMILLNGTAIYGNVDH